jgi:hypothetical protein
MSQKKQSFFPYWVGIRRGGVTTIMSLKSFRYKGAAENFIMRRFTPQSGAMVFIKKGDKYFKA